MTSTDAVYNIPTHLLPAYRGRRTIVRTRKPAELVSALTETDIDNLVYIQLLSLNADVDVFAQGGYGVPIELMMLNPGTEFAKLYRHAKLFDKHPVRVSIPVKRGFSKAVKVAASLHFAVKLEVGQPDPDLISELAEVLNFFLHHSSVEQPIEYFHSLLLAISHEVPITLWDILEEDPAYTCFVTDEGAETLLRRPLADENVGPLDSFLKNFSEGLLAGPGECTKCEFFPVCGGYFKWPRREFACDGVKTIFQILKDAAEELNHDLAAYSAAKGAPVT